MPPAVSVVIPTHNEAADIAATLDALAAQGEGLEVIVVDASQDATPEIVSRFPSPPFRLIRQSRGRGRAAARNEGILAARGEIVVVLNADVRLPRGFVPCILSHYAQGADFVLVESRVVNLEAGPGRYIQALHERDYPPRPEVEAEMTWTEGFSCRRQAALAVGLFPEGSTVPLAAGEDGWFGDKLVAAGYRKVFDRSVVVEHVAPAHLVGFWRQRVGRGRGWPQSLYERHGWSIGRIARVVAKVCGLRAPALVIPVPSLWRGWRLSARSPRLRGDWWRFAALDWVESAATLFGLLVGLDELRRAGRRHG